MSAPVIRVHNLCKRYKMYPSKRAQLQELLHPWGRKYHQELWALREVSFEVPSGQTFGIIGRNGSGKSTLLQLITGVIAPTSGHVQCQGRIAALLELGAGFNPHFSGRDNVIINGAIMGFNRQEMEERLPEIAEFSELGEFLEQPVKTYSSGMYVRLAFAAAINVDPDILIVDEALAVGDAKFQTKCYRKFEQFRQQGKTILLVTHDSGAVARYCDTALLLDGGSLIRLGAPKPVINHYMELIHAPPAAASAPPAFRAEEPQQFQHVGESPEAQAGESPLARFLAEVPLQDRCAQRRTYNPHEHRYGSKRAEIVDYLLLCREEADPTLVQMHDEIEIYAKVRFHDSVQFPIYGLMLKTTNGLQVYGSNSKYEETTVHAQTAGNCVIFRFALKLSVVTGDYFITLGVAELESLRDDPEPLDRRYDLIHLHVTQSSRVFGLVDLGGSFSEYQSIPGPAASFSPIDSPTS